MELQLAPKNLPEVKGNFDAYKKNLIKQIEEYKSMPLTEDTVAPVKSAIRQIRTTLEKIEDTSISAYFDTPKKLLKAQFSELYSIIAEGESKVDAIIAEDTRRRHEEMTTRMVSYIESKIKAMDLEEDAVEHVILRKQYYNKTAKEVNTLNDIDDQLIYLERNFAAFKRSEKKINSLAAKIGPTFNKGRYLYALSKYDEGNDETAAQAEEEAERLLSIPEEKAMPAFTNSASTARPSKASAIEEEEEQIVAVTFPVVDKKKSKGTEEVNVSFTFPKEMKKSFNELLKELKAAGIKNKKV